MSYAYDAYSPALYGIIMRIIAHEGTAEEILQQTFLKIWNGINTYNDKYGTLFTWMSTIARNAAIDKVRVKAFENLNKTDGLDSTVYEHADFPMVENEIDANNLINLLDEKYKEILDLIYLKGYSHNEAAEKLKLPIGTVKTRLRFALNVLRTKLKNEKGLFLSMFLIVLIILIFIL